MTTLGISFQFPGVPEGHLLRWLNRRMSAIHLCLEANFPEDALALVYSGIDCVGLLSAPASLKYAKRETFQTWRAEYMAPLLAENFIQLRPVDLYAARCAVLHTGTAVSKTSMEGEACEVWYQFKGQVAVNLMANTRTLPTVVDIQSLVSIFEQACRAFLKDLVRHPERLANAQERAKSFFSWGTV